MTYLNRRRKDGKPKPREIRCKSVRNVVDADAMVAEIASNTSGPGKLTADQLHNAAAVLKRNAKS
jgi:hypothetical protein